MASAQSPDVNTPVPTTEADPPEVAPPMQVVQSTITPDEYLAMQNILFKIYDYRTDDGHDPSKVFHRKPNKRSIPDYYDVITEPVALSTVKGKLNFKQYKSFAEFVRDFALISHNAQVYNRPDAGAYQDALVIKVLFEAELQKLVEANLITEQVATLPDLGEIPAAETLPPDEEDEDEDDEDEEEEEANESEDSHKPRRRGRPRNDERREDRGRPRDVKKKRGRPPKVDTPMEARIKNILKGLRRLKDSNGSHKILNFDRLPDRTTMPEYYNEIRNPIAVDVIKKKLKRKKYQSVGQFMQDVEVMFENAKIFNEDASQIYKDAVALQAEARRLATDEQSKPDSEFVLEDGRLPLPQGILHNGELYKVGDWVHIQNANDLTKPIVAQLYRTWQDASGQKFINACWYYRPEQTVHRFDRHFFENEVVKTGQYRDHTVEEIVDRCFVMFVTRFNKGRPRGLPADKEVYVCEARYNEEKFTFNKIKTWASCLPDEVRDKDYEMDIFPEPKRLKKQPSPIAYLLKDEQKETDPIPKPEWGSDNAPPKIGAVHRRPRDPRESPPPEPTPSPAPEPTPPPRKPQPPTTQDTGFVQQQQQQPQPQQQQANAPNMPRPQPPVASATPQFPTPQSMAPQRQHQPISPAPPQRPTQTNRPNGYTAPTPQANQLPKLGKAEPPQPPPPHQRYQQPAPPYANNNGPNYRAPNPVEVFHLSEAANQTIPPDIRDQFQCDDQGRVLFFTSPPLEISPLASESQDHPRLGHSLRYLAKKKEREEAIREKRKQQLKQQIDQEERQPKAAKLEQQNFEKNLVDLTNRAMDLWEEDLGEATMKDFEDLYGDQWESELRKTLKRQDARPQQTA